MNLNKKIPNLIVILSLQNHNNNNKFNHDKLKITIFKL